MVFNPAALRKRRLSAAQGYLTLEMPEQALAELAAITSGETAGSVYFRLRGEAYRLLGRYQEALADFERERDAGRTDLSLLLGMAWCYKRIDQLDKSIEVMHRAMQLSPEEPIVPYNLSCYYALAGERTQAFHWLERALEMQGSLRDMLADEADFDALRDDEAFVRLAKAGEDERRALA